MWAVVGLGNPGKKYAGTRHNVGYDFVKNLACIHDVRMKKRRYQSKVGAVQIKGKTALLALPQTYMNNSGAAVKKIMEGTGIRPQKMIVLYDDMDLLLGEIRVRKTGGSGSHKGMQSIVRELGNQTFPRIRIGIGPLKLGEDAADFVLSRFEKNEQPIIQDCLEQAGKALGMILEENIEDAMNEYNQKRKEVQL